MRRLHQPAALLGCLLAWDPAQADTLVFDNVRVFDGVSPQLSAPTTVVVRENLIASVGAAPDAAGDAGAVVVDGAGRTLTPS